jgi:hypothetical protein
VDTTAFDLPHIPTPAEEARLARFDRLTAARATLAGRASGRSS